MTNELAGEAYISLITFRRNGTGVPTPVWFATRGDKLYVFTDGTSAKVKRIRAGSRARIAACNAWGRVTGSWVDASVRIVDESAVVDAAYAALRAKYGWQMWLVDATSRMAGRFERRVILEVVPAAPAVMSA